MGQRLNLEILDRGELLANAYYHWSGYTRSSLRLTDEVLDNVSTKFHDNKVINAIRLLETTGAGLTEEELHYVKEHFGEQTFQKCRDRNEGLLAVSPKGMKETREWEEARVQVDLGYETVDFDAVWRDNEEDSDDAEKYPVQELNLENIPFSEFPKVSEIMSGLIAKGYYGVKLPSGSFIGFIE